MKRRHLLGSLGLLAAPHAIALYEPAPIDLFKHLPGSWRGSLTYRDWSPPHQRVSLPCALFASLVSPREASLYFVFQDGPGKVVHSYDRWRVSEASDALVWSSGEDISNYRMSATPSAPAEMSVTLLRVLDDKTYKQSLSISAAELRIEKVEVAADGSESFRNRYQFTRADR